jgi:hypothetical protein
MPRHYRVKNWIEAKERGEAQRNSGELEHEEELPEIVSVCAPSNIIKNFLCASVLA